MGPRQIMGVFVLATLIGLSLANALLTARSPWKTIPNQANESHVMKLACINGAVIAASVVFGAFQAAAQATIRSDIQSSYPGAMTHLGVLDRPLERRPAAISGAHIQVKFQGPCAVLPHLERFDVASSGPTQAARARPSQWTGNEVAFAPLARVLFGPSFGEHPAWIRFGGGRQLMDQGDDAYGIKCWLCHIVTPEALVSFRKEIKAVGGILPTPERGTIGKTLRQINAQQGMMLTAERERVRMNSERNGVTVVRQICMAGNVAELEGAYGNRLHGPTLCQESMNFSFGYAMNGPESVSPDARNRRNELLEPYKNISGLLGRGNNDAGGMTVLNEILRQAQNDGTTNPIIISGPNGSVRISLAGVYDAGFTRTAFDILNGRPLPEDVRPVSDARVNRAVELCARRIQEGNAPLSNENCTYSGDIAAVTFHANPANHTNPRSRPATPR